MSVKKKILVTGVAGFLGSHLAERFIKFGHEVIGVDNMIGGYEDNIPKNIKFYKFDCCNLKDIDLTPGELTVTTGDTHIYQNHLEQVQLNLDRIPQPFPKLVVMEEKDSIEEFEFSDFWLVGYKYQLNISAPMAV